MQSVMNHSFSNVPSVEIPRSTFDRSHGFKTTFNSGYLVPMFADEVLPGDTFNLRTHMFARLATPVKPFMDNLFLETFYFFVPNRLLWTNWPKFMGEQDNPDDTIDYQIPQYDGLASDSPEGLSDYLGLPIGVDTNVSAMWHRAYNKVFHDWFRDQNFIDAPVLQTGDGPDSVSDYPLRRRCKKHDYFTSCLPWPQKGPDVLVPLGDTAPVLGNDYGLRFSDGTNDFYAGTSNIGGGVKGWRSDLATGGVSDLRGGASSASTGTNPLLEKIIGITSNTNVESGLQADLSAAVGPTVNALREAFQVQRLFERFARGGSRYIEIIRSCFGVVSPDFRLQRSEFLGSSSTRININPVQQTSETSYSAPDVVKSAQGNLSAYGVATGQAGFTKSFTEHGVVIGIVNVRADLTYQRGIHRMFNRKTRLDFFWPALAHLGEQEVLNKEIYAQNDSVLDNGEIVNDKVFGYQERYAEYRYKPSLITGKFRSNDPNSLDVWHLSQDFGNLPILGEDFLIDEPPIPRVVAVDTEPQFLLDVYHDLKCARPMPVYGVPGLIDHF